MCCVKNKSKRKCDNFLGVVCTWNENRKGCCSPNETPEYMFCDRGRLKLGNCGGLCLGIGSASFMAELAESPSDTCSG